MRKVTIGNATLYHADCKYVLPLLKDIDAVVTDPPYGIKDIMKGGKKAWATNRDNTSFEWDTLQSEAVAMLTKLNIPSVIWGGNYYKLPPTRCVLFWNKTNAVKTMADAEFAWTNLDKPAKRFSAPVGRYQYGHATVKPLPLIRWCLTHLPKHVKTVLDPFMGTGTTGVACIKAGLNFVGIEAEGKHFETACMRLEEAQHSISLLDIAKSNKQPVQTSLLKQKSPARR